MTSVKILRSIRLFEDLDEDTFDTINGISSTRGYEPHDIIIHEGQGHSHFFIIITGKVKVSSCSPEGKEVIVKLLSEGDFFGELFSHDGFTRCLTVTALSGVELLFIQRTKFQKLLLDNPEISIRLMREIAGRIRALEFRILFLAQTNAAGKTAAVILQVAENQGKLNGRRIVIEKFPTFSEIAQQIGIARETVSRIVHRLADQKMITIGKSKFIVNNYEKFCWRFNIDRIRIGTECGSGFSSGIKKPPSGKNFGAASRRLGKNLIKYSYKKSSKLKVTN